MSKVLLINGSPHREGCTFTALSEVAGALECKFRKKGMLIPDAGNAIPE